MTDKVIEHGEELIQLIGLTLNRHRETINLISNELITCLKQGNKIIIIGNGGSYADALHFAGELEGAYRNRNRKGLAAIVPSNIAAITAIANDFSYEDIFKKNLEALGKEGDILIGLSTSGNSANILKAMQFAKQNNIVTIGFTGESGGKMKEFSDILLNIPSTDTPRIQE